MQEYVNKIINADCFDILKQLPDKSIDLVITDPPYGMSFVSGHRQEKYNKIENDDNLDWLPEFLSELSRVSKDGAIWYIFCSWHNVDIFKSEIQKFKKVKNILIWEKNNTGMGDLTCDFAPKYEMIIFCNDRKELKGKRLANIIKCDRTGNALHPTQKPVDLFGILVSKASEEGKVVLDCFSGSGTTAIACHRLKRKFICIEKDKKYYETSVERLADEQKQGVLF